MNITRLAPSYSVSPQIQPEEMAALKAAGFRCIVNNRPDHEEPGQPTSAVIEAAAGRLGLAYRFIPVEPGTLDDADALALSETVASAGGPVLAFCRTGNRSAKLWERSQQLAERRT